MQSWNAYMLTRPFPPSEYRKQQGKVSASTRRHFSDDYALLQPCIPSLEPANKCSLSTTKSLPQLAPQPPGSRLQMDSGGVRSEPSDALSRLVHSTLPLYNESSISPYACYYGCPKRLIKMGWLDKLSPQGWGASLNIMHHCIALFNFLVLMRQKALTHFLKQHGSVI